MYFRYFAIISPWKRVGSFIWTNLNLLHPWILCGKFGLNWSSGSGEEDFLIPSIYFHSFVIISPWKRAWSYNWINWNPLHQRMLCTKFGWNLALWFWRRRKCEKFTITTTTTTTPKTDNGLIVIRKNFRLRWAKKGRANRDGLDIVSGYIKVIWYKLIRIYY